MRSGITTISVNFATFPANQSFRPTAESMRPRAKSFIRSISQIEANRQKFSLSMTSEVRKCPKSAKSGRKTGFLLGAVKREGVRVFAMYKWNVRSDYAVRICCTEWRSMTSSPSFFTKTLKRHFSDKILNNRVCIDITAVRPNIRAILAPLESDVPRGLRAGSIFTIVRRVYILRIQRCGT